MIVLNVLTVFALATSIVVHSNIASCLLQNYCTRSYILGANWRVIGRDAAI